MITNERQYKITKGQLARLTKAQNEFNISEVSKRLGSSILGEAELNAIKSEVSALQHQVEEYELLRSGKITQLKASNLNELPSILIRARIAKGLTQRELAELVGLKEQQIQRYEAEEYGTASLRRMQNIASALKLNISEIAEFGTTDGQIDLKTSTKIQDLEWSRFPIREMYRRNWFENFNDSLDVALEEKDYLLSSFISNVFGRQSLTMHRKSIRTGSQIDDYALLAWECRILELASKMKLKHSYVAEEITTSWMSKLSQISEKFDGPRLAKEYLEESGIALVIEPHLNDTFLDGAALSSKHGPIIGLTLRYDRLDNFWFVLFHELFHIKQHLRKGGLTSVFDDLESKSMDKLEIEADSLSGEALIPENVWSTSLARYVRSKESVLELAKQLHINPAIIAGRVRYEANNYIILKELIGQGEVRKLFPEVSFGN